MGRASMMKNESHLTNLLAFHDEASSFTDETNQWMRFTLSKTFATISPSRAKLEIHGWVHEILHLMAIAAENVFDLHILIAPTLPAVLHGVVVAKVQEPAVGLVKLNTTGFGPSIQPVQVPLQSLPTLQQIDNLLQCGVICKFANGRLDPLIQIIISKYIKQD
ncbi:hypothetical protein WISP_01863 [Willisornis vidua]|uniref:Uncharacterized protein n=1 Tax=Willisornis vidua TaxID=1566151 RepID=A0ABQ9DVG2_9PASS|nr:hypothetical protein WISP_01863 [Willisornis vidua]